ncbi:MAG: hypothetical protein AAF502_09705 [Bacteroidota bacterium]
MPNWLDRLKNLPWSIIYIFTFGPAVLTMPAGRLVYIVVKDVRTSLIIGYLIGWVIISCIYYFVKKGEKKE